MKLASYDLGHPIISEATQGVRPDGQEALSEATMNPGDDWTAFLSTSGMTRIAPAVIRQCWAGVR